VSRHVRGCFLLVLALAALLPRSGTAAEILINEIMAANQSIAPLPNAPDYFPDYVELYNASGRDIDLVAEAWSLTNKKNPDTGIVPGTTFDPADFYFFPAGTIIPADSYLLVFFDNKTNFPGLHTTFSHNGTNETFTLSRKGDQIKIYKSLAFELKDSVTFGFQISDYSIGRIPDATSNPPGYFTLNIPTPCGAPGGSNACLPNIAAINFVPAATASNELSLKLNEWLAFNLSNSGKTNSDWFEIYNPSTNIVALDGLIFTDKGRETVNVNNYAVSNSYIAPFGFVQYFADDKGDDPDAVDFSLSSSNGDELYIYANDQTTIIDQVSFPTFTTPNVSRGRLPDGGDLASTPLTSLTPEASNFSTIPEVAINEVLTHTDPPLEDAIELVNLTDSQQDISNWWISNNKNDPMKFRIPAGTRIAPHGFIVFYEYQFNNPATAAKPFTLNSANGDECYIFKGTIRSGQFFLTGYRRGIDFGAAENGVSFGRYVTSQTNVDIVAMSDLSFGTSVRAGDPVGYQSIFRTGTGTNNPAPKIGPLVINEIQYNPPRIPVLGGQIDDSTNEFIEIFNVTDNPVPLYDPVVYRADHAYNPAPDGTVLFAGQTYADGRTNTWRLRDAVSFDFPLNVSLGAGQFLLVVNFDPSDTTLLYAFTNKYGMGGIPGQTQIFGPYKGKLSNGGATVELRKPDAPQGPWHPDFRLVPYIVVERIKYSDTAPWPTEADGMGVYPGPGSSLQRISSYEYGNDVINWMANTPTPGRFNSPSGVEPPSISRQPRSVTTTAGKNVTLSVIARGGQLHYQWLKDEFFIDGATSATLSLVNVSTDQSGAYKVLVSNVAGTNESVVAQLTVNPPVNDSTRPTINITTPSYASTTNEAISSVGGTASDKSGISGVFYSVNGGPFIAAAESDTYKVWSTPFPVDLAPGTNVIRAYAIDQAGNLSLTNTRSYFRSVRTALALSTTGSGSVQGATNGQLLELGKNFTLTATPASGFVFSNWVVITNIELAQRSASPTLVFPMASNLAVSAQFVPNPFLAAAGKFNGLFYETTQDGGVLHGSSGFFTLTLSGSGAYSASMLSGGFKLSASGHLDLDGKATNTIPRKGTNALSVVWCVDLAGHDTLIGTVSDSIAGWSASLNGDRAVFSKINPCTNAGKYTFTLPGLPYDMFVPGGDSYGTITIDSNGVASIKGYLADKTTAVQKAPLSRNGELPLYVSLYSGKGSLLAWLAFENRAGDDFHGDLNWSKPPQPTAKYYPLGFSTNQNTLVGSHYLAPAGTTGRVLAITNGVLTLNGGSLPEDYANAFVLGPGSKVTNGGPHKLTLNFTAATGLFKGSLTPTNHGAKPLNFAGAVVQRAKAASGYHLGTTQSDRVRIEAAP
jgi:hypothetical protein